MKGCAVSHKVQKKFLFLWLDTFWNYKSLADCEWFIQDQLKDEKIKKENPKDIVVKTY